MKKFFPYIVLAVTLIALIGMYFYARRWKPFLDNNFVGAGSLGFVTDTESGLAAGDKVEIMQTPGTGVETAYNGTYNIIGVTTAPGGKFLFVTDKPFLRSTPTSPGQWRKLNLF
jgi:hypothetical protein